MLLYSMYKACPLETGMKRTICSTGLHCHIRVFPRSHTRKHIYLISKLNFAEIPLSVIKRGIKNNCLYVNYQSYFLSFISREGSPTNHSHSYLDIKTWCYYFPSGLKNFYSSQLYNILCLQTLNSYLIMRH